MSTSLQQDVLAWANRLHVAEITEVDTSALTINDSNDDGPTSAWALLMRANPKDYLISVSQPVADSSAIRISSMLSALPDESPVLQHLDDQTRQLFVSELHSTLSLLDLEAVVEWDTSETDGTAIRVSLLVRLFDDAISVSSFYSAYLTIQRGLAIADGLFVKLNHMRQAQ